MIPPISSMPRLGSGVRFHNLARSLRVQLTLAGDSWPVCAFSKTHLGRYNVTTIESHGHSERTTKKLSSCHTSRVVLAPSYDQRCRPVKWPRGRTTERRTLSHGRQRLSRQVSH